MSDCTLLFSAVTDVRLQTEREENRDLRVVGVMSALMYVCHHQLSSGAVIWDADDTTQFFHY